MAFGEPARGLVAGQVDQVKRVRGGAPLASSLRLSVFEERDRPWSSLPRRYAPARLFIAS